MQVERVDQVKLQDIDQVNAYLFAYLDPDGVHMVMERDGVHRVEIVLVVEIDVKSIHHHHQFMVYRRAASWGIDDERAIQALGNMARQGEGVAVVQVQAKRLGIKLIRECLAGLYHARPAPGTPSISAGCMPWKWIVCG